MVPVTSKIVKLWKVYEDKVSRHGSCDTIIIGKLLGRDCAFLIQNMFPVTKKYIKEECIQASTKTPVTIPGPLANEIIAKQKKILALVKAGVTGLVFPNIINLEKKLKEELNASIECANQQSQI